METTAVDERDGSTKSQMAEWFAENRNEYECSMGFEIVYEDDDCAIVADTNGHELNEWAERTSNTREELRSSSRSIAATKMNQMDAHKRFSYADPIVFDKL